MQTDPPVLVVTYDIRSRDVPEKECDTEVERTKARRDELRGRPMLLRGVDPTACDVSKNVSKNRVDPEGPEWTREDCRLDRKP